jgi:hypothetical protein
MRETVVLTIAARGKLHGDPVLRKNDDDKIKAYKPSESWSAGPRKFGAKDPPSYLYMQKCTGAKHLLLNNLHYSKCYALLRVRKRAEYLCVTSRYGFEKENPHTFSIWKKSMQTLLMTVLKISLWNLWNIRKNATRLS